MDTAEQLFVDAIEGLTELLMEEADLLREGKVNPEALEGVGNFKSLLKLVCQIGSDEDVVEGHEDADHARML